jgi:predicted permease
LVLLSVTGLFLRSLQNAADIDIGFRSRGMLMMSVDPRVHGYTPARTIQFFTQLRERVAGLPGVTAVVCTDTVPLSGGNRSDGFSPADNPNTANSNISAELYMVSAGYFSAMGIPTLAGRDFGAESVNGLRVAVVNRLFAKRLFGDSDPIGRRVTGPGVTYQIIGVVGDIKSRTLGEAPRPVLFRSLDQTIGTDPAFMGYTLLVNYSGNPANVAGAVRNEIHSLDPALAVYNEQTIEQHLHDAIFLPRLAGTLFGTFGFIGLALAILGLYGVMSYSVSRRIREMGIRIALGAPSGAVQRLFVQQGLKLTLIAVTIGLPAAFAAAKFSTSFLYGVKPHDWITFTATPLLLAAVALLASWVPARRAAKVEPQAVLRYE